MEAEIVSTIPGISPGARLEALPAVHLAPDPHARIPAAQLPSARAIKTGQPTEDQEVWLQRPGGEWCVVLTRAAPTRRFGRVTGLLRLLLLAAARKYGPNDGWIDKSRMRDGSDKDPALNDLRADLGKFDVPGLSGEERKALLRVQRGTGLIRLGVPLENIVLDPSLAELAFVASTTTTRKDGTKTMPTKKQEEGLQNAAILLRDCRRFGAPGEVDAAKTPAATSHPGRSAP